MIDLTQTAAHNWRDNLDDVLLDIATIEGDWWLSEEMRILAAPYDGEDISLTVSSAIKFFDRFEPELDEAGDVVESSERTGQTVYGRGGWNRWCFRYDGTVEISEHHAGSDAVEKARCLGFVVN